MWKIGFCFFDVRHKNCICEYNMVYPKYHWNDFIIRNWILDIEKSQFFVAMLVRSCDDQKITILYGSQFVRVCLFISLSLSLSVSLSLSGSFRFYRN